MLNIREISGQKVAEPMQSPLTPICPAATLRREQDAQKKKVFCFFENIFVPPVEGIYVFDVNYSARRGEVSHGIKKWKLVQLLPQIILINPGETFN